ncbi:hypothetical protein KDK_49050 [Dictyobacter kobayashii]|uniref:Uncharacterized protein n=1 Tax=Dictyobacter kobayashii TaxID=2014872 RepID=A0A402APZ7_9CHLR|nr:hypothetical protein KDK_49050 [Dictyobacter kobayashii]
MHSIISDAEFGQCGAKLILLAKLAIRHVLFSGHQVGGPFQHVSAHMHLNLMVISTLSMIVTTGLASSPSAITISATIIAKAR